MNTWTQNYDPFGNAWLSTAVAAVPVVLLFYLLAVRKILAYRAAVYAFLVAIVLAAAVFGMPIPWWPAPLPMDWSMQSCVLRGHCLPLSSSMS